MPTTRIANAQWNGNLLEGSGTVSLDSSKVGSFDVSWPSRAEEPNGRTSPEELIAAAHAACYSMALSNTLAKAGNAPDRLETHAEVDFQPGKGITGIRLSVRGTVPGIDAAAFEDAAKQAKEGCPVSQALSAVEITLTEATLA